MQGSAARHFLGIAGGLCALAGLFAWIGLAWTLVTESESVTPQSDAGGQLMTRALLGTVLMITGAVFLHFAQHAAEREAEEERDPPR